VNEVDSPPEKVLCEEEQEKGEGVLGHLSEHTSHLVTRSDFRNTYFISHCHDTSRRSNGELVEAASPL